MRKPEAPGSKAVANLFRSPPIKPIVMVDLTTSKIFKRVAEEMGVTEAVVRSLACIMGAEIALEMREKIKFTLRLGQTELVKGDAGRVYRFFVTRTATGPEIAMLLYRAALALSPDKPEFWEWQGERVEAAINHLITDGTFALEKIVTKRGKTIEVVRILNAAAMNPEDIIRRTRNQARPKRR